MGRLGRFAVAVSASLRLPCGARSPGPVAELAARPAGATLKQLRRVSWRSALRARPGALRSSAPQRRAPACPCPPLLRRMGFFDPRTPAVPAAGDACVRSALGRRAAQGRGRRAKRATST